MSFPPPDMARARFSTVVETSPRSAHVHSMLAQMRQGSVSEPYHSEFHFHIATLSLTPMALRRPVNLTGSASPAEGGVP